MKKTYLLSLAVASLLLSGCGSSTTGEDGVANTGTTLTVERGPILKATVVDANGQRARDDGNGRYTFASTPIYPVMAVGGVIDMDRDGTVSVGDVVSDLNLTTAAGSVITVATTLASNPATKGELDRIAADLNLTVADIISKTPSDSKEIEAISNIAYKYMKDNNITDLQDTQDVKLQGLNISDEVHTEYQFYVSDDTHDFERNEQELMDELERNNPLAVDYLENLAEVESELGDIESELEELDLNDVKNELLALKSKYEVEYGDLDYEDEGDDINHYQGVSCASCHGSATAFALAPSLSDSYEDDDNENESDENENENENESESGENVFTSGATIFTVLDAPSNSALKAASNYTLRLVLESGTTEGYRIGRGTGNVNGTFNAGITNYTAEVLDSRGNVVNASLPNSHDASRFDCNSCHTAIGTNGAPGRIVSFSYSAPTTPTVPVDTNTTVPTDTNTTVPTDTNTTTVPTVPADTNTTVPTDTNTTVPTVVAKSFASDVLPVVNTKCASCHGSSGGFTITNSSTPYAGVVPFLNLTTPTTSALLEKSSGTVFHGGGTVLRTSSAEYLTIRDWISEGALDN